MESINSRNMRTVRRFSVNIYIKKHRTVRVELLNHQKTFSPFIPILYGIHKTKVSAVAAGLTPSAAAGDKLPRRECKKTDFATGQYSGGFTQRLPLPLKTKHFRKPAANTILVAHSHRKCTNCLKTMESELGGFTVTQQSRTTQEASNGAKRQNALRA